MEQRDILEGSFIIKQGEYEKQMFFIREGTCECHLNFEKPQIKDPKQKVKKPKEYTPLRLVKEYNPGDSFCELSLLYLNKSPGTIKATSLMKVFTLDKESYEHVMKDKAERTKNINEKLLQVLEPEEKKKLALNVKRGNFKKGDVIVKEDEYDDILYYLENMVCKTKKKS